jgi:hypothetical protein
MIIDNPGMRGSFGVKGVVDSSNSRLPSTMAGDEFTPEISGIYSNTFGGGKLRAEQGGDGGHRSTAAEKFSTEHA